MKEIKYKGLTYIGFPDNASFWKNYLRHKR